MCYRRCAKLLTFFLVFALLSFASNKYKSTICKKICKKAIKSTICFAYKYKSTICFASNKYKSTICKKICKKAIKSTICMQSRPRRGSNRRFVSVARFFYEKLGFALQNLVRRFDRLWRSKVSFPFGDRSEVFLRFANKSLI